MNDLISVIVPVYNCEKYINECILSILNQSYKNIELILVDDGSTDSSCKICDDFEKKYGNIHVIHKKNGGVSSARNCGLNISNGKYILFIDADDFLSKNMIEIMHKSFINNKVDLVVCGYNYYFNKKNNKKILYGKNINLSKNEYLKLLFNNDSVSGFLWNKMYAKDTIKNIFFNEKSCMCEDLEFNTTVLEKISNISIINDSLYYYRQNNYSLTRKKCKIEKKHIQSYVNIIKFLDKNKIDSSTYKLLYILKSQQINKKDNEIKNNQKQMIKTLNGKNKIKAFLWLKFPKILIFLNNNER